MTSPAIVSNAIQNLSARYRTTTRPYVEKSPIEDQFSAAYHWMVKNSPQTVQKLEASYSMATSQLIQSQVFSIDSLRKRSWKFPPPVQVFLFLDLDCVLFQSSG